MDQYIVSARKYRPENFETLLGQDTIAQTLRNSIARNQLSHAYLFCGPRGVGKTTTARIFAKMINCSSPKENLEPCGECESCRSFAENRSYCIYELDAASNNSVEDIKSLMEQVMIPPQVGRYSVYIIDEVHMLSQAAFNAFLKTLEEPPAHAIFILATTEKHKILPTILSRCQTYDFNRIKIEDIMTNIRGIASKEGVRIDEESLHVIAQKADGAMRDALTIFDQCVAFCGTDIHYKNVVENLNVIDYDYTFDSIDDFLKGDFVSVFKRFDEIISKGYNSLAFVNAITSHLRDLALVKVGGADNLVEVPESIKSRYAQQASKCSLAFIYKAMDITTACEAGYRTAVNQRLHIEMSLMKLSFIEKAPAGQVAAASQAQVAAAPVASAPAASAPQQVAPASSATEPQAVAVPPVAPTPQPAPVAESAPAETVRKTRAERAAARSFLETAIDETAKQMEAAQAEEGKIPSDEDINASWHILVSQYEVTKPRLYASLSSTSTSIEHLDNGEIKFHFNVSAQNVKDWIIDKVLEELTYSFRQSLKFFKISFEIGVNPIEVKEVHYMPSDQARVMAKENENLVYAINELELTV
ncbi:MAG: DNA polymerase III subunit gamma/tau [Bacteroidales bacterium]|nr:DNA polymerase III subunit gamma/tau [Bacteroidales bacterium]